MAYLTNTKLSNKERCEYAAKVSGMNVEFMDHPMPQDFNDPHMDSYDPRALFGLYGSVFTHEGVKDHGPFWRAWESYKA